MIFCIVYSKSLFRNPWMRWRSKILWKETICTRVHNVVKKWELRKGTVQVFTTDSVLSYRGVQRFSKLRGRSCINMFSSVTPILGWRGTNSATKSNFSPGRALKCFLEFCVSTQWGTRSIWSQWWRKRWTRISRFQGNLTWRLTQKSIWWETRKIKVTELEQFISCGQDRRVFDGLFDWPRKNTG